MVLDVGNLVAVAPTEAPDRQRGLAFQMHREPPAQHHDRGAQRDGAASLGQSQHEIAVEGT
jgi:hypothetical protein